VIVLDASAVVEWLLQSRRGLRIAQRIFAAGQSSHAPHLLDVEVAQALRRSVALHGLSASRAEEALEDFGNLRIYRYSHTPFLRRIWLLRENLTCYDALYVALAEALDATLLSCDTKLAAAPGHRARVEVI
jgi:predicted nucleic acid-binding protein